MPLLEMYADQLIGKVENDLYLALKQVFTLSNGCFNIF